MTSLGSITRPSDSGTIVTDPVGLLNMYEYQSSYHGTTYNNGYLNNGIVWWTLTPYNSSEIRYIDAIGNGNSNTLTSSYGVRPSINLKNDVRIVSGDGTEESPYRLEGDNDSNLSGTLLNTRYSGEYIHFGNEENNLYRIVSHENGTGTKIVSAEPLKENEIFITLALGNVSYSNITTMGTFLNGEYLTNYIEKNYDNMIEDNTTWYLGTVGNVESYKLAKYTDENMSLYAKNTNAKVGLLRFGELMAGQFNRYKIKGNNINTDLTMHYWTLTPYNTSNVRNINSSGFAYYNSASTALYGVRPTLNLKSNVIITSGDGTKENPFEIALQ